MHNGLLFFGVTGLIKAGSSMINNKLNIPAVGMKTDKGIVYPMPTLGKQILVFVASFFTAVLLGFIKDATRQADNTAGILDGNFPFSGFG